MALLTSRHGVYDAVADGGAAFDGSTDDYGALQAAINYCQQHKKTLRLPPRTTVTSQTLIVNGDLSIEGAPGHTFIKYPSDVVGMRVDYITGLTRHSATSVATITGSPLNANDSLTKVVMGAGLGSNFAVGDRVLLRSGDQSGGYTYSGGATNFQAEVAQVYYVAGDDVYLDRIVKQAYATSIELVKLSSSRFTCRGIGFSANGDPYDETITGRKQALQVQGACNALIESIYFERCWNVCLEIATCFGVAVNGVFGNQMQNEKGGSGDASMYLVSLLGANSDCVIDGVRAHEVRHVVTTTCSPDASYDATQLTGYGDPRFNVARNGVSRFCLGAALDTHQNGFDNEFENWDISHAKQGIDGDIIGTGIQDRCSGTTWKRIKVSHTPRAVVWREDGGESGTGVEAGVTDPTFFIDCWFGETSFANAIALIGDAGATRRGVYFINCTSHNCDNIMDTDAVTGIKLLNWQHTGTLGGHLAKFDNGSVAVVDGFHTDADEWGATRKGFRGAGSMTIDLAGVTILGTGIANDGLIFGDDASGTKTVALRGSIDVEDPNTPIIGANINTVIRTGAKAQAITAAGAVNLYDPQTTLANSSGSTYAVTLAAPTASEVGQQKSISMISGSGTNSVTLALTNVVGGSAATTATFDAAGEVLTLVGVQTGSSAYKWAVLKEIGVTLT